MDLPTREECFQLLEKHGLCGEFEHIKQHSIVVNKVAVWLATKLKDAGAAVNIDLVDRGSLLHDVAKVIDIQSGAMRGEHGRIGHELLKDKYPEVARLIIHHVISRVAECENWEERILMYADMHVFHRAVVKLSTRVEYLQSRYFVSEEDRRLLDEYMGQMCEIEDELFNTIGGTPNDLLELNKASA